MIGAANARTPISERALRRVPLHSAAAHGSPQAKDIEGPSRQASRPARHLRDARQRVPELRLADARPPRLPDLQDVPGPRHPAARNSRTVSQVRRRVAVDALGGDHPPEEIVAGAVVAAKEGVEPVIFGPADLDTHGLEHVVTSEMVEMDDKPAEVVRGKPDSSLVRAVRAVGDGEADAVVSAGNTGAVLAASLLHVRRLPGVFRPGIAIVIPTEHGPSVLIDAGANAEARPEHLLQFGHMGSIFAEEVLGDRAAHGCACSRSARSPRRGTS